MKKTTSRIYRVLAMLMLAAIPGLARAYDAQIGDLFYNLNSEDKTAEVTYENWYTPYSQTSIDIPASVEYDGVTYSVTMIGDKAFSSCSGLTSVAIPNSVKSIGNNAFRETALTSTSIPASVTEIGEYAFHKCGSLASVEMLSAPVAIGKLAFSDCLALQIVAFDECID